MSIEKYVTSMLAPKMYKNFYRRERQDEITGNDTLMIIDIQPEFLAQAIFYDICNKAHYIAGKVQEAMDSNVNILYIEYSNRMPTIPALAIPAASYPKFRSFVKTEDDAFLDASLDSLIKECNPEIIHAMGCFAECCVASTVIGCIGRGFPMAVHISGLISRDKLRAEHDEGDSKVQPLQGAYRQKDVSPKTES